MVSERFLKKGVPVSFYLSEPDTVNDSEVMDERF